MAKKFADILAFLKKKGVEINSEAADAARDEFGELKLVVIEQGEDGEIQIDGKSYASLEGFKERGSDIIKWKERARKAEAKVDELKDALDAGDSENKKLAEKYKKAYDELKPIADQLAEERKAEWNSFAEIVPEEIKKYLKLPKEGEELQTADILSNLSELKKLKELGVFKPEELRAAAEKGSNQQQQNQQGGTNHPLVNRTGQQGGGQEDIRKIPVTERMAGGYKTGPQPHNE